MRHICITCPLCVCYRGGTRGMTVSDEWIHEWIKLTWMEVKFNVNEKNKHHSEDTLKNNFPILFVCLHPSKWLTVMCGKKIPWKGYYSLMTKLRELPKCLVMIAFIWDVRLVNSSWFIHHLEGALDVIYEVLCQGGLLKSLYIWTAVQPQ